MFIGCIYEDCIKSVFAAQHKNIVVIGANDHAMYFEVVVEVVQGVSWQRHVS
jgi:hypothetical protein